MLSADEAVEWGLVAESVAGADAEAEADAVRGRAQEIARFWLSGAAGAYGQAKRLIRSQPSRTYAEQLAEEARSIGEAFETPEARARVAGFAAASRKSMR
jgi:2-(1,2-epoxy-1,2-dihydrophenyl)acetyl-CoA isomerase